MCVRVRTALLTCPIGLNKIYTVHHLVMCPNGMKTVNVISLTQFQIDIISNGKTRKTKSNNIKKNPLYTNKNGLDCINKMWHVNIKTRERERDGDGGDGIVD